MRNEQCAVRDSCPGEVDKSRRDVLRQPPAVVRTVEGEALDVHLAGTHHKHDGLAMPLADFAGGRFVAREMHMLATSGNESLLSYGGEETRCRSMKQDVRRNLRWESQIDFNRMSLI